MVVQVVHLVVELQILEQKKFSYSFSSTEKCSCSRSHSQKGAHLSQPVDSQFEAAADEVKAEADEAVKHAFGRDLDEDLFIMSGRYPRICRAV